MPIMIWIAMIIMLALAHWIDFGILTAIQFINAFLGWYETVKAADAVAALKASLKPLATVKRDGSWQNMDAALLVPGDLVLLGAGSNVPADCIVNHGALCLALSSCCCPCPLALPPFAALCLGLAAPLSCPLAALCVPARLACLPAPLLLLPFLLLCLCARDPYSNSPRLFPIDPPTIG